MDATEAVIRERGLRRTRLRDVAERAGVSTGMIQHYFDSRDDLLAEAFSYRNQRRAHAWAAVAASCTEAWGKITALIDSAVDPDRIKESATVYLEFCVASLQDDELRQAMAGAYEEWRVPTRAAIQQGVDEGQFHLTAPIETLVDTLAMMLDGAEIAVTLEVTNSEVPRLRAGLLEVVATLLGYTGEIAE